MLSPDNNHEEVYLRKMGEIYTGYRSRSPWLSGTGTTEAVFP
jgi:hypothetical protein